MFPRAGDVLHVTRTASVQFVKPIFFRVIRPLDWPTYNGWVWLDGYELNSVGDAVDRRSIFVQLSGLRQLRTAPQRTARPTSPNPAPAPRAANPSPGTVGVGRPTVGRRPVATGRGPATSRTPARTGVEARVPVG